MIWSTQASIQNDVPSITAIIETLGAGVLYWVVAVQFETYLLLLTSLPMALLVLIRSDESVAQGVEWFKKWETKRWNDTRYREEVDREPQERRWIWTIALSAVAFFIFIGGYVAFRLGEHFLARAPDGMAFWRNSVPMWTLAFGVLALVGIAGGLGLIKGLVALARAAAVATAATIAVALLTAIGVVAAVALAMVGALAEADVPAVIREGTIIVLMFLSLVLPIWLGIALGVFIVSLAVRIGATLRYFVHGVKNLPRNFRRLMLCTSPLQVPELVPGLVPGETDFTLWDVWRRFNMERHSNDYITRASALVFYPLATVIWFVPAWAYRAVLKSTVWFWYTLAYLGSDLRRAKNPHELRRQIMGSLLAWTNIAIAVGTIAVFIWSNFFLTGTIFKDNPYLSVFGYFLIADWSSVRLWQILSISYAIITIAILYWVDNASGKIQIAIAPETRSAALEMQAKREFGLIERLARVRFVMFIVFQTLVGTQVLLYFNSQRCWFDLTLPANVESWAELTYGQKLPRAICTRNESPN